MQEQYKNEIQRLEDEGDVETLEILKQDAEVNKVEGIPELAQQAIERLRGKKEEAVEVPAYQTNEMAEYGGSPAEIQPELDALNQEAEQVIQSTEEKIREVEGASGGQQQEQSNEDQNDQAEEQGEKGMNTETSKEEAQEKEQSNQEREADNIRRYYEERINQANQVIEMATKRLQEINELSRRYEQDLDTPINVTNNPNGPRGSLSVEIGRDLGGFRSQAMKETIEKLIEGQYNIFKRDKGMASLESYIEDARNASEKAITDAQTEKEESESKMERDLRKLEDEMAKAEELKVNSQEKDQG